MQNKPLQVLSPKMKCLNLDGKKNSVLDCESINNDFSFYEFLMNLDEKNVKDTIKNNKEWFNKL